MTHGAAVMLSACSVVAKCAESRRPTALSARIHVPSRLDFLRHGACIPLGMTNAEAKRRMLSLLEACGTYEQVIQAITAAVESQWADRSDVPAELGLALGALSAASDAFQVLDEKVA